MKLGLEGNGCLEIEDVELKGGGARCDDLTVRELVTEIVAPAACSASEAHECLKAQEEAKKMNVMVEGLTMRKSGIPDTTKGLFWCPNTARAVKKNGEFNAQEAEKAELAAAQKQRDKDAKALCRQQGTAGVLALLRDSSQTWEQSALERKPSLMRPTDSSSPLQQ